MPVTAAADTQVEASAVTKPNVTRPAETLSARLSKTEQLIADLIAAGGVLRVPYWRREGEPDYRQRAIAAQRFGKVPPDKRLVMEPVRGGGELEIRLDNALPGMDIVAQAVPVPTRLSRPHPVAARFRDDTGHHQASRAMLTRSVRIVHALAAEGERRGHKVTGPGRPARERSARDSAREAVPHLVITVGNHAYSLNVSEEKVMLRGVWEDRKRAQEQYQRRFSPYGRHERMKSYDSEATGRLSIGLLGSGQSREGRAATWSDRKSWRLEDKLPELLLELELRAVEDDHRALKEKREAEERQRQWELEMEHARRRFLEAHRANVLRAQVAARHEAQAMSAFLTELEAAHEENPESADWIAWIRDFIRCIDPLHSPPSMPADPEITPGDLKAFLPTTVNPYGPERW